MKGCAHTSIDTYRRNIMIEHINLHSYKPEDYNYIHASHNLLLARHSNMLNKSWATFINREQPSSASCTKSPSFFLYESSRMPIWMTYKILKTRFVKIILLWQFRSTQQAAHASARISDLTLIFNPES